WSDGSKNASLNVEKPGSYWVAYYETPCLFYIDSFNVKFVETSLPEIFTIASCKSAMDGKAYVVSDKQDSSRYLYHWKNSTGKVLSTGDSLLNVPGGSYSLHISTENCDTTLFFNLEEIAYKVSFEVDSFICVD